MDMTEKDDNRQKLLKGIYQDADWLKSLVENILSLTRLQDGKILVHAEANAILKVARSANSTEGATLYCTLSPCLECSKLIIQSGIKRLVYSEQYRDTAGLELLERAGIEIKQLLQ